MSGDIPYLAYGHEIVAKVNANTDILVDMNIRTDAMGIGWMLDTENNIIWHDGGTSNFNTYMAFNKKKQIGVVVLSNYPPVLEFLQVSWVQNLLWNYKKNNI